MISSFPRVPFCFPSLFHRYATRRWTVQALLGTLSGHTEFLNLNVDDTIASISTATLKVEDLEVLKVCP